MKAIRIQIPDDGVNLGLNFQLQLNLQNTF